MNTAAKAAEPIRIGIVGAGDNTRSRHIPGLKALPGVELVSVCNRRRESSEKVAQEFGIPTVYDRWEDLVAAADTQAIVIGTWPYLHAPVTLAALAAGKHVLCEARMAMNYEEAARMLAAARAKPSLVAQVVPSPFTLHVDRTVNRLIGEGYLGQLLAVDVRANGGAFLDRNGPLSWRRNEALSGRNIMSLGIWYETIMRWVGEAASVMAAGKVFVTSRPDPDSGKPVAVRIPEHLDVLADLRNGAQAHLQISSVQGLVPENEVTLFGADGTLRFSANALYGGRREDTSLRKLSIRPDEIRRWRVEEEFIHAIRGIEQVTLTDFATGARYMAFTDAVAQSLAEGRRVDVPV
ncbi:MAG: Gfo/Idh/MocA family oxidoreductase [Lentisphaerae bacterium]|nr:Gfo/Idh/MocA family oxidoreductase [Lentisphaerota bacterium]